MSACPQCGHSRPTPAHEFLHDHIHNLPPTAYSDLNLLPIILYDKVAALMIDFAARQNKPQEIKPDAARDTQDHERP